MTDNSDRDVLRAALSREAHQEILLKRVEFEPNSGCWLWTRMLDRQGYGRTNGKIASRLSYEAFIGPIPDGLFVLHRCDTPPCINPDHLFLGTTTDNMRDCISKGRFPDRRGEANGNAKLTQDHVRRIKARLEEGVGQTEIAREFGVARYLIWSIQHGTAWAHV